MAGPGALNLSLLSRGIGEVQRNGHEKVEVKLEPEDYFNWVNNPDRLYLPPVLPTMPTKVAFTDSPQSFRGSPRQIKEVNLPKTFTTRKGALLIFSEDMAQKMGRQRNGHLGKTSKVSHSLDDLDLHTVEDFARSILSYGSHASDDADRVYLKFVHDRHRERYKIIRPGYSPKRYLASWSKCLDDNFLGKLTTKGYIGDRSLQKQNMFLPHIKSHISEDLSGYPAPYRIMRQMLMSPGSLSGYTFFWARPVSPDSAMSDVCEEADKQDGQGEAPRKVHEGFIKVLKQDKKGHFQEVTYEELDSETQQTVLTELLVKSAISHALVKQQEALEEADLATSEHSSSNSSLHSVGRDSGISPASVKLPEFDMVEAVQGLLNVGSGDAPVKKERKKQKQINVQSIPDRSNQSKYFHTGSFKGGALRSSSVSDRTSVLSDRSKDSSHPSWAQGVPDRDRPSPDLTVGTAAGHTLPPVQQPVLHPHHKDHGVSPAQGSNIPVLPPIEGHADLIPPPIQIEPPTPQATTLTGDQLSKHGSAQPQRPQTPFEDDLQSSGAESGLWGQASDDEDKKKRLSKSSSQQSLGSLVVSGSKIGGSETPMSVSIQPLQHGVEGESRTSKHPDGHRAVIPPSKTPASIRNIDGSKKGLSLRASEKSSKSSGSVLMGPDGEVLNIGGAAPLHGRESVSSFEDEVFTNVEEETKSSSHSVPDRKKKQKRSPVPEGSDSRKSLEDQVIGQLTEHASRIAANVLSQSDAGMDLAKDAKFAAEMWTDRSAAATNDISHSQSARDTQAEAIRDMIDARSSKSAEPSVEEYKDLLKNTLTNIVANTGNAISVPPDADIDDGLVTALMNESLTPDDIEVVKDEETGKSIIRSKSQMSRAMGGIEEGHIYQKPGGTKGPSIPGGRTSMGDVGELDIINYRAEGGEINSEEVAPLSVSVTSKHSPVAETANASVSSKAPSSARDIPGVTPADVMDGMASKQSTSTSSVSDKSERGRSVKSLKSRVSVEKKEEKPEFVVGKVKDEKALPGLYGPYEPPKKEESDIKPKDAADDGKAEFPTIPDNLKAKPKKGKAVKAASKPGVPKAPKKDVKKKPVKKGKKKSSSPSPPAKASTPTPQPPEPTPPPKETTPKPETTSRPSTVSSFKSLSAKSEESMEFIIVHDEFSDEEEPSADDVKPILPHSKTPTEDDEDYEGSDSDESQRLRQINNRNIRAAKRNAQAEKRRQEVERKRREREEQVRKERDEHERQERLKQELEEDRRRKEEERRIRKQQEREEKEREERARIAEEQRRLKELERERKIMEEHQRRLEELKRKQMEEEALRRELQIQREREEQERLIKEAEMLAQMKEEERREYEKKKREEEERRKQEMELERQRLEEEAKRQMEEAKRLAEEMERKKKELEQRLKFSKGLVVEANGMSHSQDITRAFVWSYYELLQWLGLDLPKEPFI